MLNLLKDHISNSLPSETLVTNPNLPQKVDETGKLLPFRGNTTVFLLDDGEKDQIAGLQAELYAAVPEMLAEPLGIETFHMTLHDLVNGASATEENMARAEREAGKILQTFAGEAPIPMRGTWMFNMVDTSLVLGLEPVTEQAAFRLEKMYLALESVVPLGYGLTPHITMAYYRPGTYSPEQLAKLRQVLKPVEISVNLYADRLVLQNFEDMNNYITLS